MGADTSSHQTHALSGTFASVVHSSHTAKSRGFNNRTAQTYAKVNVTNNEDWWTGCQTLGFVHDVPASGVAMIPDGNYREAGARHLRSPKAEETATVR